MKFIVKYDNLKTADNGDTTYYGGTVSVNGQEFQAHGNDRGTELQYIIAHAIEDVCAEVCVV